MFSQDGFPRRHKILSGIAIVLFAFIAAICGFLYSLRYGPYDDYELDFLAPEAGAAAEPGDLEAGVAKRDITPVFENYDAWEDVNNNGRFDKGTDRYTDRNGNGRFDGIWLAGFGVNRPAKSVHDPLWARAIALRNNGVLLVLVTLDSIGIYHNDFITIRKMVDPGLGIDQVVFSSTHCHEAPDTMKIWSGPIPILGYQRHYVDFVQRQTKEAIEEAVRNLGPADMYCAQVEVKPEGFVRDSRKPIVMDNTLYLARFTKLGTEETIATLVNYGNHPETLGSKNPHITSDFPHWLRQGVERGVGEPFGADGLGGMCLYFQGMVGGLMTQLGVEVPHRDGQRKFKDASFEKAEALGENLAVVACRALRSDQVWKNEKPRVAVAGKTFLAPVRGLFRYGLMLGLIHEGYYAGGWAKTEINVIRIGDVLMLTTPGEIYPEIVEGGVEALAGQDFATPPVEVPPLREEMERHARMAFVIGLANDEIGYMVPKSQWDKEAPYVYGKHQYGEQNSPGPDCAPTVHRTSLSLLQRMNTTFR